MSVIPAKAGIQWDRRPSACLTESADFEVRQEPFQVSLDPGFRGVTVKANEIFFNSVTLPPTKEGGSLTETGRGLLP
jgi:hypothetical protein